MKFNRATGISDRAAIFACCFLALTSLAISVYQIQQLAPLLKNGKHAEAVVIGIERGFRNSKRAIYQFPVETGNTVTSRDIFQMYIIRLHKGDHVTVMYDPSDTENVTADTGLWIWQGPVIFLFGFVFLVTTGVLIFRFKPGKAIDEKQDSR